MPENFLCGLCLILHNYFTINPPDIPSLVPEGDMAGVLIGVILTRPPLLSPSLKGGVLGRISIKKYTSFTKEFTPKIYINIYITNFNGDSANIGFKKIRDGNLIAAKEFMKDA